MSQPDTWPRDQKKKDDEVSVACGTSPVLIHVRFLGCALAHTMPASKAFVRHGLSVGFRESSGLVKFSKYYATSFP